MEERPDFRPVLLAKGDEDETITTASRVALHARSALPGQLTTRTPLRGT
jgi:hypothetical protein